LQCRYKRIQHPTLNGILHQAAVCFYRNYLN
jgi:hypothetical protein